MAWSRIQNGRAGVCTAQAGCQQPCRAALQCWHALHHAWQVQPRLMYSSSPVPKSWDQMVEGQGKRLQGTKHISLSSVCHEQALLGAGQGNIRAADLLCNDALRTLKLPEQWQIAFLTACTGHLMSALHKNQMHDWQSP